MAIKHSPRPNFNRNSNSRTTTFSAGVLPCPRIFPFSLGSISIMAKAALPHWAWQAMHTISRNSNNYSKMQTHTLSLALGEVTAGLRCRIHWMKKTLYHLEPLPSLSCALFWLVIILLNLVSLLASAG